MNITQADWENFCDKHITAGYTPLGGKRAVFSSGKMLASILRNLLNWEVGNVLVDIGCANGRLAMGLLGSGIEYHGVEIIPQCVDFCKAAFQGYDNYHFYHVDIHNQHYWAKGKILPQNVMYPFQDNFADIVIASSVFSHTGTVTVASHILKELKRIVKKTGVIYTSWFFTDQLAKVDTQEAKTVYLRQDIETVLLKNKLAIQLEKHTGLKGQTAFILKCDSET